MTNNTIFDDVFRTMVEKMTYLVVPLINEVFHTAYPEDVKEFLERWQKWMKTKKKKEAA